VECSRDMRGDGQLCRVTSGYDAVRLASDRLRIQARPVLSRRETVLNAARFPRFQAIFTAEVVTDDAVENAAWPLVLIGNETGSVLINRQHASDAAGSLRFEAFILWNVAAGHAGDETCRKRRAGDGHREARGQHQSCSGTAHRCSQSGQPCRRHACGLNKRTRARLNLRAGGVSHRQLPIMARPHQATVCSGASQRNRWNEGCL
jgi:hypothetical protein